MLSSNSNKGYFDPQGFTLVFGRTGAPTWTIERTDSETFTVAALIPPLLDAPAGTKPTGGKFTFDYKEFINFGGSLTLCGISGLSLDDSSVTLKEKNAGHVSLIFKAAEQGNSTVPTKYRPVLHDSTHPENDLPIPESVAIAISNLVESLNQRL